MQVIAIETPSLGDRSYPVIDGASAAAVDQQRDIDRILSVLEDRNLVLRVVVETHLHQVRDCMHLLPITPPVASATRTTSPRRAPSEAAS